MSNTSESYTGTIDSFLDHCSKLNINEVEEQVKLQEKQECLEVIMEQCECSIEEAEVIYNEIALAEVKETIDQMVKDGLVEVSGYNEDGEPLFVLTELGKQVQKNLDNR